MRPGHRPKERYFAGITPALCFNLDTDGMVSELVVRNLPYSLAEVSFLSLDSACRSPVALFILFLSFFFSVRGLYVFGYACSSVSLSRDAVGHFNHCSSYVFCLRQVSSTLTEQSNSACVLFFRDGRCRWVFGFSF